MAANAIKKPIDNTQQAGLQLRGHVADFIQKQRAFSPFRQTARRWVVARRTQPRSWPNSLGFQQVARNGGGVDSDKRLARGLEWRCSACATSSAAARSAGDQHRDRRLDNWPMARTHPASPAPGPASPGGVHGVGPRRWLGLAQRARPIAPPDRRQTVWAGIRTRRPETPPRRNPGRCAVITITGR